MPLRKATHLALTLLFAAGLGVSAASTSAQSTASKKTSTAGSKSHRKRSPKKLSRWEKGQKVPTPDRISEIQQALAKDGSFTGTPNGKWDDSTVEAMKKFQDAHGLNPSGAWVRIPPVWQRRFRPQVPRVRRPGRLRPPTASLDSQFFLIAFLSQLN
jgi:peptidoglycan hydrolase-like protein with peptidoglycan-binding domain